MLGAFLVSVQKLVQEAVQQPVRFFVENEHRILHKTDL